MTEQRSFDDILDSALDELRAGQPIAQILGSHPGHAAVLRPLLEAASAGINAPAGLPPSDRLLVNFSAVSTALSAARQASGAAVEPEHRVPWSPRNALVGVLFGAGHARSELAEKRVQWAPRRLAFASLSLPAFALAAFVVVGTGGAAAAALVVEQPRLARIVADAVTPDWIIQIRSDGQGAGHGYPPASSIETPTSVSAGAFETATPASTPQPIATDAANDRAPDRASPNDDGDARRRTPASGGDAIPRPSDDSEHARTPSPESNDEHEDSATPSEDSGDGSGHDSTPGASESTPPASGHTPGSDSGNNSGGHASTSTPSGDDGDGHSSKSNGNRDSKARDRGNSDG